MHAKSKLVGPNQVMLIAIALGIVSFLCYSTPNIAGALGISTASAVQVVNLVSAYSTVAWVVAIVGAITGVGSMAAGITATVLYIIKKQSKAKAVLW